MNTNTPTTLGMGDLARSINCATELLTADTGFLTEASPAQLADTMGLIVSEYLRVTADLMTEFNIQADSVGARRGPQPQATTPSATSPNGSVAPSSTPAQTTGGLNLSDKQEKFFHKVIGQAEAKGYDGWKFADLQGAPSYDIMQERVSEIKRAAGYGSD